MKNLCAIEGSKSYAGSERAVVGLERDKLRGMTDPTVRMAASSVTVLGRKSLQNLESGGSQVTCFL